MISSLLSLGCRYTWQGNELLKNFLKVLVIFLAIIAFFCQIKEVDIFVTGLHDSVIVGSNNNYLTSFNNWLAPVAKSVNSVWKRCWRASVDGWAASTFHSQCDGKGPTVTIIRVGRYIFGGYTSKSWGKCAL